MGDKLYFTVLVVGSLLAVLYADVGPRFVKNPEPIVAPLGDEVEFDCSLDVRADHLRWKHNGRILPYVFNDTAKSQMIFKMNDVSLIGDYQCIAWYGASAIASNPARLSLAELGPIPLLSRKSAEVSEGNTIGVKCRIPYSKPAAVIQYYKNNKTLQAPHLLKSGTLLLPNVSIEDSGVYSCSITNSYVQENAVFLPSYDNIVVRRSLKKKSPQFSFLPQSSYDVQMGSNITLECIGYGEPPPKYTWRRKNGEPLQKKHQVTSAGLLLVNVTENDQGVYLCEVDNGIPPKLQHNFEVALLEVAFVERGPSNLLVKEGGRALMDCAVRGKPPPKITWLLNAEPLHNDTHMLITGSVLEISSVEKRHAGMYQCIATNILGSSFGSSTLHVEPLQVTAKNSIGTSSFSHNPRFIEDNERIPQRQPEGNKYKKFNKTEGEMVPPSRPSVTRLTGRSVMVRWYVTPNKGLPILFFKVQHRELSKKKGSRWKTNNEDIPPHVGSYEVGNLTPERFYRFRIAAVYSNMDNKLSPNSARFWLDAETLKPPPTAPKLVHTSAAGPESIRIAWHYQRNSEVPIEGFYVYYRSTSNAGDYVKATVEGEKTRSYVINYLNEDTFYDIKLQSFTVNAASEFSEILIQKTARSRTVSPLTEEPTTIKIDIESNGTSKSSNQLYITLGAVLGGLALLLMLCLGIFFCNKHKHSVTDSSGEDGPDKSGHIQMEPINVNGHINRANGHAPKTNGYVTSKVNITNNPLADSDEDKNRNIMEISFITRTSTTTTTNKFNSLSHRCRSVPKAEVANSKVEISNPRINQIQIEGFSSGDNVCDSKEMVIQNCGMESNGSWRRRDVTSVRTVENYV